MQGVLQVIGGSGWAFGVGVLRGVAEATHPREFTELRLMGWLKLSQNDVEKDQVCPLPAWTKALIDEDCREGEARTVVGKDETSGGVNVFDGRRSSETQSSRAQIVVGQRAARLDRRQSSLRQQSLDGFTSLFPANHRL